MAINNYFEGIISIRTVIENMIAKRDGEIVLNDRKISKIFLCSDRIKKYPKENKWLVSKAKELDFEINILSPEEIAAISSGNTHGGILAECTERNIKHLESTDIKKNGFYVLLDGIEDPFNFGYSIRSLYAAGVDAVIIPERNWMSASSTVSKSSAAASEMIPMFISNAEDSAEIFKNSGYKIVCADLRNSISIYEADLKFPIYLIVGGEKRGISRNVLDKSDVNVRIDYARDFKSSLSAASAATIASFEIMRQNMK